jgi:hypothetical protein
MMVDEILENERRETISEMSDLLLVLQEMGRRLANETHGDAHAQVRDLNESLHEVRLQVDAMLKRSGRV